MSIRDEKTWFYREHQAIDLVKFPPSEQVADVVLAITDGKESIFLTANQFKNKLRNELFYIKPPSHTSTINRKTHECSNQ